MKKKWIWVLIMLLALVMYSGSAGAEDWKFLAGGDYNPHEVAFSKTKKVAVEIIVVDLAKNEVLPLDEKRVANLATVQQHMTANMALKEVMVARLQTGEAVAVSQYAEPVMVLREEIRRQLSAKGFTIVKEGAPNVFRLKIYGSQKGELTDITRFIGIVVDGVDQAGKVVFSYDAGVLYSAISSKQDEMIKEKIAPSLIGIISDAFNLSLVKK